MDRSLATHNMAAIIMTTGCQELRKTRGHSRSFRQIIGIILLPGFEVSSAEVVSMATGTKCLDWDGVCHDDSALRDCHAEVVCRRALLRFLYAQLEMLLIR